MCVFLNHFTPFIFVVDNNFLFFLMTLGSKVAAGEGRFLESQKQLQTLEEEKSHLQNQVRPAYQNTVYITNCFSTSHTLLEWFVDI